MAKQAAEITVSLNGESMILPLKFNGTLDFIVLTVYFPEASGLYFFKDNDSNRQSVPLINGTFMINASINCYYIDVDKRINNAIDEKLIRDYHSSGYSYGEIVDLLSNRHSISMSLRTLKRKLNQLGLKRRCIPQSPATKIIDSIFQEVKGSGCCIGYKSLWYRLKKTYGLQVHRDIVLELLRIADPEGIAIRKEKRFRKRKYSNKGPNALWHLDGYDKLKPYGFAIHGCVDGFSRKILWLDVAYTNNNPDVVAYYYLQTIKNLEFIPRVIRADHGTENVTVESLHQALRFYDTDSRAGLKSFVKGPSTSNQRIESYWSQMRKSGVDWWISFFKDMRDRFLFDNSNPTHTECLRYCFGPLIKYELDMVRTEWNRHRIRRQRNQEVPPGRPDHLFFCSEKLGWGNQKISIDIAKVDRLIDKYSVKPVLISNYFCEKVARLVPDVCQPITPEEAIQLYVLILESIENDNNSTETGI